MARKQKGMARYAFIGLIVALVGCIGSGLAGLTLGAYKLNLFPTLEPARLSTALYIALGVLVAGVCIFGILDPDRVRRFLSGRQARYGSNAVITSVAFLVIVIVLNLLAFQNPWKMADATEDQQNTLAPETLRALATLPGKVEAIAFYSSQLSPQSAQKVLQNFKTNSNGNFDYRFVDPETDPLTARQAGITGDGKILLTLGDHKEIAAYADETELTRSLIRLINPNPRSVYFLNGHGEPDIEGSGDTSLSIARQTLESKNYTVKPLSLISAGKIPEDALAVIIAGPRKPLLDAEVALLRAYVNKGGALVVMEDPVVFTEFADSPDPLAAYLSADWGVSLDNDVVIDLQNSQNLLQAISDPRTRANHPITQNMTINYLVILPQARSLSLTSQPAGVTQTPLIFTTDQSWGESQFTSAEGSKVSFDAAQGDIQGPLTLAVAAENAQTGGRLVVFGNSIFASDGAFDAYGNGNIFVNAVDWAAEQENLIQITPRQSIERTFNPPLNQFAALSLLLGPIFVIPGLILAAGISSWVARRRRG